MLLTGSHHYMHHLLLLLQFPEDGCLNSFDPPDEYLLSWITNKNIEDKYFSKKII